MCRAFHAHSTAALQLFNVSFTWTWNTNGLSGIVAESGSSPTQESKVEGISATYNEG